MAVEERILSLFRKSPSRVSSTYITKLPSRAKQAFQSSHDSPVLALLVFDPACPVALARRDQHLLGVRGHAAVEILLALDVQTRRHLAALTRRRRARLDDGEGRRGRRCVWDLDLGALQCIPSSRKAFRKERRRLRHDALCGVDQGEHVDRVRCSTASSG